MIEEYIPEGYENRISRWELKEILHKADRSNRQEIEDALYRGVLIASCDGGYFRERDEKDTLPILEYIAKEKSRARSQIKKVKMLEKAWYDKHPKQAKDKDQIPGQISFEW